MHVRDICIVKYNGFCCLQKFNLFPKMEYHSLFSDLFIFYIFFWKSVTILLKIWEVEIFKFGNVSGPMAAKWPKVNRRLKIVNYFICMRGGMDPHTFTTTYFWQYVGQYVGPLFSWEKINQYFWYHPEIFLGVFYDNLC